MQVMSMAGARNDHQPLYAEYACHHPDMLAYLQTPSSVEPCPEARQESRCTMPIAEALAIKAGETALTAAVRVAAAYLESARAASRQHAETCAQYLGAASIAIRGLEQEVQILLVEADNCDWRNPFERQQLRKRIAMYLFVDRIRPVLWESIVGIEACQESLRADADRFFQAPGSRDKRDTAVALLADTLTRLQQYRDSLGHLAQGSGPPGTEHLLRLHELIPRPYEPPPDEEDMPVEFCK